MTNPRSLILDFERRTRFETTREHALLMDRRGQIITTRQGDEDSVTFDLVELRRAEGGLLSHNHPRCLPFSENDLTAAAEHGLTLRAYGAINGQMVDYTVAMPSISTHRARAIQRHYGDALEQAERELSRNAYDDATWQRESRHLAITRLAEQLNFVYQRTERRIPLNESVQRENTRLDILAQVETTMRDDVFSPLHAALIRMLTRHADQARIPMSLLPTVQREAAALVQRTMLGKADGSGALAPYNVRRGDVEPRSDYFAALWKLMWLAARAAIAWHADLMRKRLPDDVLRAYDMANANPFTEKDDETLPDPLYLWVGKDGKTLADRVWNAAGDLQRRLLAYLAYAIASGKPISAMAGELESALYPGKDSATAWGNLSYEPLRLARTEVAFAGNYADYLAGQRNPLVETYSVFTSPLHMCCDHCDVEEANSPYPKSDMSHLPPFHPHCMCGIRWNIASDVSSVIKILRGQIKDAITSATKTVTDLLSPLSKRFVDMLFRGKK